MEDLNTIPTTHEALEGIDLKKLRNIVNSNWIWIGLIIISTNLAAYLVIRYTQPRYEAASELKLDVKQNATDLGFSEFIPEQQGSNLISGEIESIQSKSFLNQIIDSLNLHVSYFSIGKFLNTELYTSSPFTVWYGTNDPSLYDVPITIIPKGERSFQLRESRRDLVIDGAYMDTLNFGGLRLVIRKNNELKFIDENTYSFVINSRDGLLQYLADNLTVEPLIYEANTIRISFKDSNPIKARDLVNGIDSIYILFSHNQKNQANKQKIEWLNSELSSIETKMDSYENYFEDFTLKNRTSDLGSDLKETIKQINKIDSQRFEINKRLIEVNKIIDAIGSQQITPITTQHTYFPDYLNKNIEALQELYLEMDRIRLSNSEITFAFKQKQNQIESLQQKALSQLRDLRTRWVQHQRDLNKAKAKLESDFASMPDKNTQFDKNQRFYKLYEEFYLMLMQNRSQFEIAQAGSTPDFKILSTASLPKTPIAPNKPVIFGIGFVAGIVLNVFFIGLLYLTNNKINNLSEIERMSKIPLLGMVPALSSKIGDGLYITRYPKSMVSEAIRTLRTNLDFFNINTPHRVIAISSTVSGEGKSFIAMNLGSVLALSKKKVVLLDLDMRKTKPNTYFNGNDKSKGVSTILIRKNAWQECVLKSEQEHFDFIPAGPHPPNPSELLMNGEFHELLQELKKNYDYILLDTPPVGLVTDGIMAMKQADTSIYLFRAGYSKKEFIHSLHRIVRINKLSNVTTVLNALPAQDKSVYGYGYYEQEKRSWTQKLFGKRV